MRSLFIASAVLFLCCQWAAFAQSQNMQDALNSGAQEERVQRLVDLGVDQTIAQAATKPISPTLEWMLIRGDTHRPAAVLFLPCNLNDSATLYSLVNDGKWHVIDKLAFDCHYDNSVTVELGDIITGGIQDVLVHHACAAHGTGILQQDFKIIRLVGGRFRVALDTEEVVRVIRSITSADVLQRSVFVAIPTPQSFPRAIEETRSTVRGGHLKVERRLFHWSSSRRRFLPTRFMPVIAQN